MQSDFRAESDDALMTHIASGDQRAFGELYDRYASRVLGLAIRLIVDRALAEEVAQEVFLEIWQKASRFDPARGALASWVLMLTRMRAVSRIRSEDAARRRTMEVGARELEDDVDVVAEAVDAAEMSREVQAALAAVTDVQREALVLYSSGRSYREMSETLGVPVGTMKTRVHDGLKRMRVALTEAAAGGGAATGAPTAPVTVLPVARRPRATSGRTANRNAVRAQTRVPRPRLAAG